jgi:hypothetical protein
LIWPKRVTRRSIWIAGRHLKYEGYPFVSTSLIERSIKYYGASVSWSTFPCQTIGESSAALRIARTL